MMCYVCDLVFLEKVMCTGASLGLGFGMHKLDNFDIIFSYT